MTEAIITVEELNNKLKNIFLIDVREPDEHEKGIISGALCVPLGRLIRDLSVLNLPKEKDIVCYCKAGFRGQIATDFLNSKGYKAKNLAGGYMQYKSLSA